MSLGQARAKVLEVMEKKKRLKKKANKQIVDEMRQRKKVQEFSFPYTTVSALQIFFRI